MDYELLQSNITTTNTTTNASPFQLYSILVCAFSSGPFVPIFAVLFIISLTSFIIQRNQLKKNQIRLFVMLFAMELVASLSNGLRSAAELALLHPEPTQRLLVVNSIKVVDRFVVSWLIFLQALIMAFICGVL